MPRAMENGAIARLTEREKDCLRRWLRHETAKEIALDLGISPHGVEKRLKMARAKLGVASSLEAARLLEASEGYQQAGTQSADLAPAAPAAQKRPALWALIGVVTMMIIMAAAAGGMFLLAGEQVEVAQATPRSGGSPAASEALAPGFVRATTPEITSVVQTTFRNLDADRSGFLEGQESPLKVPPGPRPVYRRDERGNVVPTGETTETTQAEVTAGFYRMTDKDKDGKISFEEYFAWSAPMIAQRGIPARWKEDMNRPIQPEG